ncbi:DNA fragmentation factor subunit beta-like [Amphiura filiformis]|uniref:DNA fragmentation factor subunit beta-like n=1 Tax=Amphiura filiformis TaxID=82378 RepID=UPI003B223707
MPSNNAGKMQPYKIRGVGSSARYGVVAGNLKELIKHGCKKLQFTEVSIDSVCLESDGTEIDEDYFQTLPPNEVLVLVTAGNSWQGVDVLQSHISSALGMFKAGNLNEQIQDFFEQENASELYRLMMEFANSQRSKPEAETKNDHPDWFQDIEPRFKTKSDVMQERAKSRIRSYYAKTKEILFEDLKTEAKRKAAVMVLDYFQAQLREDQYKGVYFVRTASKKERLCNEDGWFPCQGAYDESKCVDHHVINPYGTKEHMVLFSTWNLDHVIEKSREVIPTLSTAIQRCPKGKEINWPYFYELLFTKKNLKLVDIRCHKKGKHTGGVSKAKIYRQINSRKR